MSDFRDYEPEDSYDAGDPIDVRLDALERVTAALSVEQDDRVADRLADALRRVHDIEQEDDLDERDRDRLRQIRDVLEDL